MSKPTWSFPDLVEWLRTKGDALRSSGAFIAFDVQTSSTPSARLRVERRNQLGELTVWKTGMAHVAIVDLTSGEFTYEKDGVSLAEASPETVLGEFFMRFELGGAGIAPYEP